MSADMLTGHLPSAATGIGAVVNTILVVDDDKDAVTAIKSLLETQNYIVVTARDGGQAHAQFTMRKPDFVLLDVMLPNDTGFEVCERFKVADVRIPVMFLTGVSTPEARDLAMRVGADGFLVKPASPKMLLKEIPAIAQRVWEKHHGVGPAAQASNDYVRFGCKCGRRIKVAASHRGKQLTCPQCGDPVLVPRHD
jgi:two-component system, OmpR family, response regulator